MIRIETLHGLMPALGSNKLYLAAAAFGIALVTGVVFFVVGRKTAPVKTPVSIAQEDESLPQLPVPPPLEAPPAPRPAQSPPTPAAPPVALPTPSSGGDISEKLVLARRIESSDPKRSRELLSEVLAADPQNVTALARMSKKLVSDEDALHARELAERCLSVDEGNAECSAVKAALPADPPSEAQLAQARACLERNSQAVDCSYAFAENALYEGKKEAAVLIAMDMHKINPSAPITNLAVGRVKAALGSYREALPYLQAACDGGDKDGCFRANLLRQEGF